MPLTRFAAYAFGVVTICLVVVLILLGLLCIIYSFYFRSRIHSQGCIQLSYFSGPWIIRITFILFAIWWGFGEVIRLSLWRRALDLNVTHKTIVNKVYNFRFNSSSTAHVITSKLQLTSSTERHHQTSSPAHASLLRF
ncbi:hypothetical protein SLA2020_473860 [Shorea laevis]